MTTLRIVIPALSLTDQGTMARRGRTTSKAALRASKVDDVEAKLSDIRTETITVGGPIGEQSDAQLFFVDQIGSDETGKKKLRERGLLGKKPLKMYEILKPASKVLAIVSHKSSMMSEKKLVDRKIKAAAVKVPVLAKAPVDYDIWATPIDSVRRSRPEISVRAVKVPKGGASYRPAGGEHEKLMEEAAKVEIKKIEAHEQLQKLVPPTLLTGRSWSAVDLAVQEVITGEVVEDPIEEPTSEAAIVPSAQMKKKTKTERNREAKLKAEATRIRLIESEKKARQELMHIKGMSRAVQAELAIKNAASEERRTAKKRSQIQTLKRLGKVAFTPAPIAVQIPEELSDSLRQMKTEGNLVMDRFKSLQERALIEPVTGIQRKRQKTKVKLVDPYSYRDFK